MPGHSRSKNGVALLAYVPGSHAFRTYIKAWMAGISPATPGENDLKAA
jgi:hypothetical protein